MLRSWPRRRNDVRPAPGGGDTQQRCCWSQYLSFAYGSGFVEAAPVSATVSQWRPQAEHRHSLTIPVGKKVELIGAVITCPQAQVSVPCDGERRGSSRTILAVQRLSSLR